jgi:Alpha/beta hydrolase domain
MSKELTGGNGVFMGSSSPPVLKPVGYVQREYLATGTATSYKASGPLSYNGRWTFAPDGTAAYRTRAVVRMPAKASDFSGNVIVEWLNVSGGVDADPEWATLHEEIVRNGDA